MRKYRLAVFDMDGTILDTLDDLRDSLNFALTENGYPQRSLEQVRSYVGNGIRKLIERGVPEGTAEAGINAVHAAFKAHYEEHCYDKTKPYDGITDAIKRVRNAGMLTAVVSNKDDSAVKVLADRFFGGLFDYSVGSREGIRKKPCPDSVNEVLVNLGVKRDEAVYIGDSEVDIETAENAGMDCLTVLWGFRDRDALEKSGAKKLISSPDGLAEAVISK